MRAGLEALGGVHQARLDVGAAIEPAVEDWAQHPEGNREANAQEQGETGTPNPNKCTHGFSGFKHKIAIISIPRGVVTENSSDLDSGRRPKLRSVEFFVTTPLVIEIRGRLFVTFPDFVYTYWDSESIAKIPTRKPFLWPRSGRGDFLGALL